MDLRFRLGAHLAQVDHVCRRVGYRDRRGHPHLGVDVDELARLEQPPPEVGVHALRGDHGRRQERELTGLYPQRPRLAALVETLAGVEAADRALQDPELVGIRVAERPEVVGRRQDHVQRVERDVGRDLARRGGDSSGDVAALLGDPLRHQREVVLRVGLAVDEVDVGAEPPPHFRDVAEHPVVGEEPPLLLEGMRVLEARLGLGRVSDVGEERAGPHLLRVGDERLTPVRRDRLAVDHRRAARAEAAEPNSVRLALALEQQARRRGEEPELRLDLAGSAAHPEKPAHRPRS